MVLAGALTFLFIGWQINHTGARDEAQQADAIVILGARVEPNGQAGPDLRARTLHAVSLFQRGLAPYVICTGGYDNDRLSAAAVACDLAVSQGVPADKVLLADGSMTTREDAARAADLMAAHGLADGHPGQPPAAPGARPHPVRERGPHRLSQPDQHRPGRHPLATPAPG